MRQSEPDGVDPRRALWRRGSYEIVGDWLQPASLSVLDRVDEVAGHTLRSRSLLDVATGTGAVALEAARRGATVTGVDLTDELVAVARQRATAAGIEVRFEIGDFDRLADVLGDATFDVVTSSFGVMFAPEPATTLARLAQRLNAGGLIGVTSWHPDGVFIVPDSLLELLPERPPMPDMAAWSTAIAALCSGTPLEVASTRAEELAIPFTSVADCADQLERWSGGWAQLLDALDSNGVGDEARQRFLDHLASFSTTTGEGTELRAGYHTTVLRRSAHGG